MIYSEQLLCSPFVMCQIGASQNEFLLLPSYLEQKKTLFSKMIYLEVDKARIVDSFFRVVSYEDCIVIVHYWATTHKEPKSGRGGLFTVCGLTVPTTAFKKRINEIIKLSDAFFQIIDEFNSIDNSNDSILKHENGNNCISYCQQRTTAWYNSAGNYFDKSSYSDTLWKKIQERSEELSAILFKKYIDFYESNNMECHASKKEKFLIRKISIVDARSKRNAGNIIWLETNSNANRIKVFLQESNLLLKKKKTIDVASLHGIYPFSICFHDEQTDGIFQLLYTASSIEKCNYNGLRYIKLELDNTDIYDFYDWKKRKSVTEPSGAENQSSQEEPSVSVENPQEVKPTEPEQTEETAMQMKINGVPVSVRWENNDSVAALIELVQEVPLTIQMSLYSGFEQVGSIGTSLPHNDVQTTTAAGDIVLYSGNQIIVFYGSNSLANTKLGRITYKSASEMMDLLGNEDVTITISI